MTFILFALLGGLVGAVLSNAGLGGFLGGAALGILLAWLSRLQERVAALERRSERPLPSQEPITPPARGALAELGASATATQQSRPHVTGGAAVSGAAVPGAEEQPSAGASLAERPLSGDSTDTREALLPSAVHERIKLWLTTGNVPAKVGVLLSLFGVGFLVKEAMDRAWLSMPIEVRLLFVAVFGLTLLAVGWRLERTHRVYALSLQGGGIAMLYLTTYASFALYGLLPAVPAFAVLVLVTVAAVALAVLQDSRALAVLGIIGGFLAPLLVSSDAGDHVVLFGYYLILNGAIITVAWFRAWRELNVLGFLFTFVIGGLWGYEAYRPEHFATTEPFLVLFVLLYTVIPVLFATRQAPQLRGFVDGTLVFGTPIVGFALQSQLVGDTEYGLAASAAALAVWYAALAAFLHRHRTAELAAMIEALIGMSIVFATLAVPLALDANWTSALWAVQGAAMVWLGARQHRLVALASGVLLQCGAGAAYLLSSRVVDAPAVLNGDFLGAVLLAVAGAFSSRCLDRWASRHDTWASRHKAMDAGAIALLAWATLWWLAGGLSEIGRHVAGEALNALLIFIAATVTGAVLLAPRLGWPRLNALGVLAGPVMALGLLFSLLFSGGVLLSGYGWIAWPAALAAHYLFLRLREERYPELRASLHVCGYWILAAGLAMETAARMDGLAGGAWPLALTMIAVGALVLLTLRARELIPWPVAAHWRTYLRPACGGVLSMLAIAALLANILSTGDPTPFPFVPLLNPLEAALLFVAGLSAWWCILARRESVVHADLLTQQAFWGALGVLLLTMSVARAVHHWLGVPFELEQLAASSVLQAALSMVWGVAALTAMVFGARHGSRSVWVGGAALMGVVVVKLFVVELGNVGTVSRVVSFLGVGLLLLVVGYFAPAPPRAAPAAATAEGL